MRRGIWVVAPVVLALLSGCIGSSAQLMAAEDAQAPADAPAPAGQTETIDLGTMQFMLGPTGNTPVTSTSVAIAFDLPDGVTRLLAHVDAQGVSTGLQVDGPGGCDWQLSGGIVNVNGNTVITVISETLECIGVEPGPATLRLAHTTGSLKGTVGVTAEVVPEPQTLK